MRFFFLLLFLFLNADCFAAWRLERSEIQFNTGGVTCRVLVFRNEADGLRVHWVRWGRQHTLRVIDLEPGESVAAGAQRAGALAGVNGGYFYPDFTPMGLVVSQSTTLHRWERSRLLTGVLSVSKDSEAQIHRNAEFKQTDAVREALQAGPFLVDHGRSVPGLDAMKVAERTVVVADNNGVIALLITSPVTLARLGEILAEPGLWPEKIERALNLDGGSSTALWLADGFSPKKEWKRVRNAVVVVKK